MIGHEQVRAALERGLPPATLLRGPPSVGKWTLAHHLRAHHQAAMVDTAIYPDGLNMAAVRRVRSFVATAPFGTFKLVMARLDGTGEPALNALLKTLEEPPATARFLLSTSSPVLSTIMSRCQVYRLGLLRDDQVEQILRGTGLAPTAAARRALLGRGQVRPALEADDHEAAHTTVTMIGRAIATHDRVLFAKAFTDFDDNVQTLFHRWLIEAASGQYRLFTEADMYGLHTDKSKLLAMIGAVTRVEAARARLGVRAALEPFLATV